VLKAWRVLLVVGVSLVLVLLWTVGLSSPLSLTLAARRTMSTPGMSIVSRPGIDWNRKLRVHLPPLGLVGPLPTWLRRLAIGI
jgi:hypothetical protein